MRVSLSGYNPSGRRLIEYRIFPVGQWPSTKERPRERTNNVRRYNLIFLRGVNGFSSVNILSDPSRQTKKGWEVKERVSGVGDGGGTRNNKTTSLNSGRVLDIRNPETREDDRGRDVPETPSDTLTLTLPPHNPLNDGPPKCLGTPRIGVWETVRRGVESVPPTRRPRGKRKVTKETVTKTNIPLYPSDLPFSGDSPNISPTTLRRHSSPHATLDTPTLFGVLESSKIDKDIPFLF